MSETTFVLLGFVLPLVIVLAAYFVAFLIIGRALARLAGEELARSTQSGNP